MRPPPFNFLDGLLNLFRVPLQRIEVIMKRNPFALKIPLKTIKYFIKRLTLITHEYGNSKAPCFCMMPGNPEDEDLNHPYDGQEDNFKYREGQFSSQLKGIVQLQSILDPILFDDILEMFTRSWIIIFFIKKVIYIG